MTKQSFEDYLQDRFVEDEPTVLDDDMPDAFDDWLSNIGIDLFMAYAEKWNSEQLLAYLTK